MSFRIERKSISSKSVRFWLLTIQLLLLYFPILKLFSIQTDNGAIPASLCYFFSLAFVPYLVKQIRTLRLPPWYLTGLYFYTMFLAAIRVSKYGFSKAILHWTFGFYLLVVILNIGVDFQKDEWMRMLEMVACTFAVVHFVFILFQYKTVLYLLKGYFWGEINGAWGVLLYALTRGGRNLDCTWLGLGAFFVRGKKKSIYVTYAILFAFLGGSRVGVISIGMAVLWSLLYDPIYKLTIKKVKWYVLYAVFMILVLFLSGTAQAFLSRMFEGIEAPGRWLQIQEILNGTISTDLGETTTEVQHSTISLTNATVILSGRAAIWKNILPMFKANPFGYGVGNAMRIMKSQYGFSSFEDIVHNVFFQWLLDEGFLGGIAYLGLLSAFLYKQWKQRLYWFESPFDGYFLTYFILSLVQFHGGEALMIFVLGIYLNIMNMYFVFSNDKRKLKRKRGVETGF